MPRFIDVDSFAGGEGASLAIEAALGKPVDIAINHDPEAIAMHAATHPRTRHYNHPGQCGEPDLRAARKPCTSPPIRFILPRQRPRGRQLHDRLEHMPGG